MDEQNYILESEKKVLDIIGLPESLPRREIHAVGIIGAGTMGGGIAMNFANVGIPAHIMKQAKINSTKGYLT